MSTTGTLRKGLLNVNSKDAVKNHSVLVEKVLENAIGNDNDSDDGTWTDVFEAANKKAETLDLAQVN